MHAIAVVFLTGITFTLAASNYKFHLDSPNYEFGYRIFDEINGQDFGHSETRRLDRTDGVYYVLLPDGRKQTVKYYADGNGYFPKVTYEQVTARNNGGPILLFNQESNIFGGLKTQNGYSSSEFTRKDDVRRPHFDYTPFKGVQPLKHGVGISTSNFDFHKNRKINFVDSKVNINKKSNGFGNFPLNPPAAFTQFKMNNFHKNKNRFNVNKGDFNIVAKPIPKLRLETKSILKPRLETNFDSYDKSLKSFEFARESQPQEENKNINDMNLLNPTDEFTALYIPSEENSVSGFFKPLTNGKRFSNKFLIKYISPNFKTISDEYDRRVHEMNPEESVVPSDVPVIYPVEGDVAHHKKNWKKPYDGSDSGRDDENENNFDYWDDDYL